MESFLNLRAPKKSGIFLEIREFFTTNFADFEWKSGNFWIHLLRKPLHGIVFGRQRKIRKNIWRRQLSRQRFVSKDTHICFFCAEILGNPGIPGIFGKSGNFLGIRIFFGNSGFFWKSGNFLEIRDFFRNPEIF